jgi:hypothetical protein
VGYMINGNNQLERLSKGLTWNGVSNSMPSMVFNPLPTSIISNTITANWTQIANGSDPNYQVLGDQVFRLEYCFLVQTSPTSSLTVPNQTTTIADFNDTPWITPDTAPNALRDVTAIIVSIAVLDTKSRVLVSSAQLQAAAGNLPDDGYTIASKSAASLPLTLWKAQLTGNKLGLPQTAASQVRFYQRYCYLNHLQ